MKRILYSLCVGSTILGLVVSGATAAKPDSKKKRSDKASAQVASPAKGKTTATSTGKARVQRSVARPRASSQATVKRNVRSDRGRPSVASKSNVRPSREVATRSKVRPSRDVAVSRERASRGTGGQVRGSRARSERQVASAHERNIRGGRAANVNRNRNVTITNNWSGSRFAGPQYAAFRNYSRVYHDRAWYTSNYTRIIFVTGGWWYWNAGYWFPAWGYAPYAYYPYDGPIYTGYADLTPDQVIANVQIELQRDGYYVGPIDGILGPMTRRALAAFQVDHGLAVTSTIDRPTLSVLGVA
jgi:hypothetical protein